jgi:hypothetical protein
MVAGLLMAVAYDARAQGCNPAVDGTYCESQGVRGRSSAPQLNTSPIYSLSESLGPGFSDQPATIGAITFGTDGARCMGLMRRSRCKN